MAMSKTFTQKKYMGIFSCSHLQGLQKQLQIHDIKYSDLKVQPTPLALYPIDCCEYELLVSIYKNIKSQIYISLRIKIGHITL